MCVISLCQSNPNDQEGGALLVECGGTKTGDLCVASVGAHRVKPCSSLYSGGN